MLRDVPARATAAADRERPIIRPTHHCWSDVLDCLAAHVADDPRLRIAHGLVLVPDGRHAGSVFAHAWCENDIAVIDAGLVDGRRTWLVYPRARFYVLMRVLSVARYSLDEARRELLRHQAYGPWRPEYVPFCGRFGDAPARARG